MGGLFGGGGNDDGGAAAIAQANLQAAREAREADQRRWEQEQATAAKEKADLAAKEAAAASAKEAELAAAKAEEQKQAAAKAVTGTAVSTTPTRTDQAKFLASASGSGLPGFSTLLAKYNSGGLMYPEDDNQQTQGYMGQGNSLVAPKFTTAPGGRKYY